MNPLKFTVISITAFFILAAGIAHAAHSTPQVWLPWTSLTLEYGKWRIGSSCKITELAQSFPGAKQFMRDSSGFWYPISEEEDKDKISFTYVDGLLNGVRAKRFFYKDMATCERHLKTLQGK